MKATEIEFSAKRRRKRLGIKKAIPKASAKDDVPKKRAFVISRTRPKTRDISVKNESLIPELTKFFFMLPF